MYDTELERQVLKADITKKVKKFFSDIPKEKKYAANDIIEKMSETLYIIEMLKAEIDSEGIWGTNGNGKKSISPAIGAFNNTMKLYLSVFKQMCDFLGDKETKGKSDELLTFLKSKE